MKYQGKLIIAILSVSLIAVTIAGATFAYWRWVTNTEQQTSVTFTVPKADNQLKAKLDGGASTTVSNLAPAACTNSTYAMKKEVTLKYLNGTGTAASVKATLTVSNFTAPHGTPNAAALGKLHYSLTTSGTNCTTGVVAGGNTSAFKTSGAIIDNVEIKTVPANTTTEGSQKYYLWVWIDPTYTHTNEGSVISDPMQDMTFTLTWTGTISNS